MSNQILPTRIRILCGIAALAIAAWPAPGAGVGAEEPATITPALRSNGSRNMAGVISSWTFSRSEDVDFDSWPEGWQRKRDRDHPAYPPVKIAAHDPALLMLAQAVDLRMLQSWPMLQAQFPRLASLPPSIADLVAGRYFRIGLDGGWAMVQSPPVPVDPLYRYLLELSAQTESLVFDHAYAELVFLDAKGNVLTQHETKKLTGTTAWTALKSELVAVPQDAVSTAVRLLVRPINLAGESDITGAAGFDDISIRQLPQMRITTDQRLGLYDAGQRPTINVRVLGLDNKAANVHFVLKDIAGQSLAEQTMAFQEVAADQPRESSTVASRISDAAPATAIEGTASWELPALRPGFYVIQSLLGDAVQPWLRNETSIAILAELPSVSEPGPYGWTLPSLTQSEVDAKRLPDWLKRLSVGVVKYPCWFAPEDQVQLDATAWLVGRLQEKEIRLIGMLDHPPESVLAKIDERERREPYAANLFRDTAIWQPLLEPIMTRLTLKVKTWQLGADNDYSFRGRPQLKQSIRDINRELQGFGQPIGLALSWHWLEPLPPAAEQSWYANNLSSSTPLAADELDAYLQSIEEPDVAARKKTETWVNLDPLDSSTYELETRITDLVLRMMTIRGHRVPAAFVTNPLDPGRGLLRPDWRPGELLLPWRTTAALLGDLTKVGSLPMRGGSSTVVLANANRSTVVVWNPVKKTEQVYLGDSIRQVDVWGNATTPKKVMVDNKPSYQIDVGPVPSFLVDLDPVLVAFRMSTRLLEPSLDSLLGRRQTVSLEFANPTQETLSGEVRLRPRADWEVDSRPQPFDLAAGRATTHTFDVSLRNSAKIGKTPLEFDFTLRTQPPRSFSVSRSLYVGPDGLDVEVTTRLSGDELLVLLSITNRTLQPQQYDCMLFPPGGRQYQRRQVIIPAGTTMKRLFPWSGGAELVGEKMLLRAVEQNGERVLNQLVDVTP